MLEECSLRTIMYEGKNIHYSSTDSKLLCSFSGKLCNQRRLNGYGFCVRHILEDPTAPFRRCAYVAKSSNQMCTQAIPNHEERRYCNNHMQVLGMLPKKERKKKEKLPTTQDSKLSITAVGLAKTKFSLSSTKDLGSGLSGLKSPHVPGIAVAADFDDPYAFPDGGPAEGKLPGGAGLGGLTHVTADSILGKSLQSGQGFVRSASDITSSSSNNSCLNMAGGSIIAKFYPELAEKLEKARAKPLAEPKSAIKSRARTSRTMNKLQTKIAQNKINEKIRKSQELNYSLTDSNSSPLQMSSPEHSLSMEHSPSPGCDFSPASTSSQAFSPQAGTTPTPTPQFHQHHSIALTGLSSTLAGYEQSHLITPQDVPPLPQVDTSFLATLAAQDNLGFHSGVGDDVSSSVAGAVTAVAGGDLSSSCTERLQLPQTPPRLPPPYPGSSTLSTPSSLTSSDMPSVSTTCTQPRHRTTSQCGGLSQTGPSGPQSEGVPVIPPFTPPQQSTRHRNLQSQVPPSFLSPPSSSPYLTAKTFNNQFSSTTSEELSAPSKPLSHQQATVSTSSPSISSSSDIFSMFNLTKKQASLDLGTGLLSQSHMLAAHMSLPPPPPYVPPSIPSKVTTPTHQPSTTTSSKSKATISVHNILPSSVPKMSVPHTKLKKLRGLLSGVSAKRKLKSDLASDYYSHYVKRKKNNHYFTESSLFSSDDGTEDEDADILPWQRDMFSASSDEEDEVEEDDEIGNTVPMSMRPTKISLLKTQLRRQWMQGRRAAQVNSEVMQAQNEATLSLIQSARESGASAVRALWQIKHIRKSKKKLKKKKSKFKPCCHKNEKEGQCKNVCLPYANHCVKHITYNVDQQLFDFCTAKFASNVQCCLPSFDLRHELPLCQEHAAKADNYQRLLELENKKKPRKKSKPPALTRPPRKGKKKKKGRYSKPQKPMPPPQSIALDSTLSDVDVTSIDPARPEDDIEVLPTLPASDPATRDGKITHAPAVMAPGGSTGTIQSSIVSSERDSNKHLDHTALELPDSLLPSDFDKPFELPLEQATNLLEESDLQEVVNKMPFDALDLFGKSGEADHEPDAVADLPSQQSVSSGTSVVTSTDLNSAARSKEALEKLLSGTMSEEESMQLAMVLAQSLHSDAELGRHARLLAEAGGVATEDGLEGVGVGMGAGMSVVDGNIFGGGPNVAGSASMANDGDVGGVVNVAGIVGYGGMDLVGNVGAEVVGEMGIAGGNMGVLTGNAADGNFILSSATAGLGQSSLLTTHVDKVGGVENAGGRALLSSSQVLGGLGLGGPADAGASKAGMGQNCLMVSHQNPQLPVTGPPAYHLSSTLTSSKTGGSDLKKMGTSSQPIQQPSHLQQQHQLHLQQKQNQQRLQHQVHLQKRQQRQTLQQQQQKQQPLNQAVVSAPLSMGSSSLSVTGEAVDAIPSILTADLNTVYGQIESLSRFQMAAQKTQGLGLNHLVGLDPFTSSPPSTSATISTAKAVIRHLPTGTVSPPSSLALIANTSASTQISLSSDVSQRSVASAGAGNGLSQSLNSKNIISSPPNVCLQQQPSRVAMNPPSQQYQNVVLQQPLPVTLVSSSCSTSSGLALSAPSLSNAKLSTITQSQSQLHPSQSHNLKMQQQQQQQQHQLQQLQMRQQHMQQHQQLRASPATVKYMLQVASSASSSSTSPSPLPSRAKLILPDKVINSQEIMLRGASPKPFGLPKFSPGAHRLNLNSGTYQEGPKQSNFPPRAAQSSDSSRLKLTSSGTKLLDSNTNKISLTKSFNTSSSSSSPSPPSFNPLSSSPKPSGFVKLLPGGGTCAPPSSSSSTSPLMSNTFRPPNLLDGADNAATELISVTVRQPSSMESVPSTVRHTLPDVCPTAMTLPSTPPLQLPSSLGHQQTFSGTSPSASLQPPTLASASSASSSPSRTSQNISSSTSSSPTPIKLSGRQHSLPSSPMQQHATLRGPNTSPVMSGATPQHAVQQNGLQFVSTTLGGGNVVGIGSRAAQVVNKFQGNKTAKAKNKANNVAAAAAEAARLSALASAAGVPVVCNPVSLPGFAPGQGLSTPTFKSSGSS